MRTRRASQEEDESHDPKSPAKAARPPTRPERYARAQMAKLIDGVSERAVLYGCSASQEKEALLASVTAMMTRIEELEALEAREQELQLIEFAGPSTDFEISDSVGSDDHIDLCAFEEVESAEDLPELEPADSAGSNSPDGQPAPDLETAGPAGHGAVDASCGDTDPPMWPSSDQYSYAHIGDSEARVPHSHRFDAARARSRLTRTESRGAEHLEARLVLPCDICGELGCSGGHP